MKHNGWYYPAAAVVENAWDTSILFVHLLMFGGLLLFVHIHMFGGLYQLEIIQCVVFPTHTVMP